jgi:nitroreductase
MLHTLRFSLQNADLFHNATFFGSCIIHILDKECAKI